MDPPLVGVAVNTMGTDVPDAAEHIEFDDAAILTDGVTVCIIVVLDVAAEVPLQPEALL